MLFESCVESASAADLRDDAWRWTRRRRHHPLRVPGRTDPGLVLDSPVSHVDLAPTVLSRTVAPTKTKRGNGALVVAALAVVGVVAFFAWPRGEAPKSDGPHATNGDPARTSQVAATPPGPSPQPAEQKGQPSNAPGANEPSKVPEVAPTPKPQPETSKPAVDTEAPRRAFFAELAALPMSPRTAAEVDAHLGRLRARAAELRVTNEAAWTEVEQALTKEKAAATARDAIRAVKALATFEQRDELVAAAQKIDVSAYRADAEAFVQTLFDARPAFLRVLPADLASLRAWAHWKLDAIEDHAGPDRALAWIDDAFDESCHRWARRRRSAGV